MKRYKSPNLTKKDEYGDWQTSLPFAMSICEYIKSQGIRPQVIIEPTCGLGNFIVASLLTFDTIEDVYGIEIYKPYIDELENRITKLGEKITRVRIHLYHENIFDFDIEELANRINDRTVLAIGNPPWVTNSKLSEIGSENLPSKSNFKKVKGLEAITGKANFDIAEYISIRLIKKLSSDNVYFAFLLKNSVIKNILYEQKNSSANLSKIEQYNIDAQKEFGVSVSAALLYMRLFGGHERICDVYDFYTQRALFSFGWVNDKFVSNVIEYNNTKILDGQSPVMWRSGLKHDCSKIMELSKKNGHYENGLGEIVKIEEETIYPLIKSSDINGNTIIKTRKYVIVTQHYTNEDTDILKEHFPKTYQYLIEHAQYLDGRKSSIYKDRPRFSLFGIGDYSFKKYKVVVSGLYKHSHFSLVSEIDGKIPLCDDTCYLLGFDQFNVAKLSMEILNSPPVQQFIHTISFNDAKRSINKELLMRIDLCAAIDFLKDKHFGLSENDYITAVNYLKHACE